MELGDGDGTSPSYEELARGLRYPHVAMAPAPAITFAIPYFANLDYLREAITSVQAQTIHNWELLIVDDCGPEPPNALVESLGDPRIRCTRNEANLGLAGNWNESIRQSTAPLVTLLHSDDRLLPGYGAAVIDTATHHPDVAAFFTGTTIIGADGNPARSLPDFVKRFARRPASDHLVAGDAALAAVLANNYIFCPTLCYRTALVGTRPFDARWTFALDLDNITRLLLSGQSLYGIRATHYEYRRHRSNQTSALTANATRFTEEIALYRKVAGAAAAIGWQRSARTARHRWMVRTHLAVQSLNDLLHGRLAAAQGKALMLWADLRQTRVG